jgi:hypothetical protein
MRLFASLPRPLPSIRSVAATGLAFAVIVGTTPAQAEPLAPQRPDARAPASSVKTAPSSRRSLQGFDVLASAGWGASTATIGDVELAPYGAMFGADVGYTWSIGFRLGAHFDAGLGREVVQGRDPRVGRDFDFTADTSSYNGGFSVGWDLRAYSLLLRYTLRLGVTAMRWDFAGTRPISASFDDASSPSVGLHLAPGVALLWPYRWFEGGVGFDYLAQAEDGAIPSGFVGKLLIGVRQ